MARDRKNSKEKLRLSRVHPDALKAVWAVIFLGASVVMILSAFDEAGPAGRFVYASLAQFFGIGYYLLPVTLFIAAGVLLSSDRPRPIPVTMLGLAVFIVTALGLIDITFPEKGGFTGVLIGTLEAPFGFGGSLVLLSTFVLASFIVMTNWPVKISWEWLTRTSKKKEGEEKEVTEIKIPLPTALEPEQEASNQAPVTIKESEPAARKLTLKKTALKIKNYVPPPLELLKSTSEKPTIGDLRANANVIKRTLDSFGIPVEMGEITVGPTVTRYTLKPAEGVKLSRITALNQDLALALAAHPIRIEAPIPGKSLVGIEVPNKSAALVRLGGLMSYPEFHSAGQLTFILGRDVGGEPIFSDISKMPHLLIAGSTGSGKSVMIHSLLISLLYKNSPATLRLILVDPKKVELSVYEDLPHLVAPVVTEGKKALGVFRWVIQEMEKRYQTLLESGVRDIKSYNSKNTHAPLHYILIVIDELADLMAAYGREVEGSIIRLAQMARATGIHLVVSTQRPSVEVITGLIKANITSRIALQVASQIDSRTILDSAGAEKLLGNGDLLFVSPDFSKPKRIQGAYIPEEEIKKVADFIRENNPVEGVDDVFYEETPPFNQNVNLFDEALAEEPDDELYEEAVKTVIEAKKASASLLQRRLKIGYARAARLLDIMEAQGRVGPADGAKPREVFLRKMTNE